MKKLFLEPKQTSGTELAEYVRDAYVWALDFKRKAQKRIQAADCYFKEKEEWPDLIINLCGEGKDCASNKVSVNLDAIGHKIDTFMAVATDAVIQADKPWTINPTAKPKLPNNHKEEVANTIIKVVGEQAAQMSGGDPNAYYQMLVNVLEDQEGAYDALRSQRDEIYALIKKDIQKRAMDTASAFDLLIQDDMQESNWEDQLDDFFYHFAKFDFAVMKTPEYTLGYREEVSNRQIKEVKSIYLKHENIHPKDYYCAENTTWSDAGTFEMDVSSLSLNDLKQAKGFDGFLNKEIDHAVEFFCDSDRDWLSDDYSCADKEKWRGYEHIDVIKYHGKVDGDVLLDWVSTKNKKKLKSVFKNNCSYECAIWVIHDFVVYAHVSLSNIVRRPYKVATYSKRGTHRYDGQGIFSICYPYQRIIDRFFIMMMENADLAAGGVIGYNRNKIATDDFHPSMIRGGARIPVKSSVTDGGNDRPIFEIRFDSHVSEFFNIIIQNEGKMDERSQIPSSSIGFGSKISSVRSTGIAAMNQAAVNKAVIRKVINVEKYVVKPSIKEQVAYHLWNTRDPRILDGAVDVQVAGYSELIRKQDKQQNLDLIIQNMIGLQNAINQMQAQGQDVSGLIELSKKYIEMAGFDSDEFWPTTPGMIAGDVAGNVEMGGMPELDGRSEPPMDVNAQI